MGSPSYTTAQDLTDSGLLVRKPFAVLGPEAMATRSVPSSHSNPLVGEEHPVLDVLALGDPPQRRLAVQPTVDLRPSMAAQLYPGDAD